MFISSLVAFARGVLIVSFLPLDLSTALAMPPMVNTDVSIVVTSCGEVRLKGDWSAIRHPHLKYVESFMDDTCRGKHEWAMGSSWRHRVLQAVRMPERVDADSGPRRASTARHSTLKVGCFGKPTCRIGENHLPIRVKFVHAPMSIKFSVSCIRMAFLSVRFAQREGCFLFIMLIMVTIVVAREPTESSARTGRRTGATNF